MTARTSPARPTLRSHVGPAVLTALPAWFLARALVAVAYAIARYLQRHGHLDDTLARTTVHQGLLAWDGAFYADIAQHGYAALGRPALRFFPLTPLLGRAVGWLGTGPRVGVVVVANLAALAAGALLVLLVRSEGLAPGVARRSAWLLALAPSAFVLALGYAEAIFLALAIATLLAVRRRHWLPAIALGVLAGLDRPGGLVLAVPVAIELVRAWPSARAAERFRARSRSRRRSPVPRCTSRGSTAASATRCFPTASRRAPTSRVPSRTRCRASPMPSTASSTATSAPASTCPG